MSTTNILKTVVILQVRLWTCGYLWVPKKQRNKLPRTRKA